MIIQPERKFTQFLQTKYFYDEIKGGTKTGETLMAHDDKGYQVVIKRPPLNESGIKINKAKADLEREERALRMPGISTHPAVCRLLSAGEGEEGSIKYRYLVLEWARGTFVPELIKHYENEGKPFPLKISLEIMEQLLGLLAVAHDAGVLYNDVKDDHLFWDEENRKLKVIDWGNAVILNEQSRDGEQKTAADDILQCGQLLYYFVQGHRYEPIHFSSWKAGESREWLSLPDGMDSPLKNMIKTALHPDPSQRYPDGRAMLVALTNYRSSIRDREANYLQSGIMAGRADDEITLQQGENDIKWILVYDPENSQAQEVWAGIQKRRDEKMEAQFRREQIQRGLLRLKDGDWKNAAEEFAVIKDDAEAGLWAEYANIVLIDMEQFVGEKKYEFETDARKVVEYFLLPSPRISDAATLLVDGSTNATTLLADDSTGLNSPYTRLLGVFAKLNKLEILYAHFARVIPLLESEVTAVDRVVSGKANKSSKDKLRKYKWKLDGITIEMKEILGKLADDMPLSKVLNTYYLKLDQKLKEWATLMEDESSLFVKDLINSQIEEIVRIFLNSRTTVQKIRDFLQNAQDAAEQKNAEAFVMRASDLDPHNKKLVDLHFEYGEKPSMPAYQDNLPENASPEQFSSWLSESRQALNELISHHPKYLPIKEELIRLESLQADWSSVAGAAQEPSFENIEKNVEKLDASEYKAYHPHVLKVIRNMRLLAENQPWRLPRKTDMAEQIEALDEEINNGTIDYKELKLIERVRDLIDEKRRAETVFANHFIVLAEAQSALGNGDLATARNKLAGLTVGGHRWSYLNDLYRLADSITQFNETEAKRVYGEISKGYENISWEKPLEKSLKAGFEALPGVKGIVKRYFEDSLTGLSELERLPALLQNTKQVSTLIKIATKMKNGLSFWYQGDFEAAGVLLKEVTLDLNEQSKMLKISRGKQAADLDDWNRTVGENKIKLSAILNHTAKQRKVNKKVDPELIWSNLKPLVSLIENIESNRPAVWIGALEELQKIYNKGKNVNAMEQVLQKKDITNQEKIYPLFDWIITFTRQETDVILPEPPHIPESHDHPVITGGMGGEPNRLPTGKSTDDQESYLSKIFQVATIGLFLCILGVIILFAIKPGTAHLFITPTPARISPTRLSYNTKDPLLSTCLLLASSLENGQWQVILNNVNQLQEDKKSIETQCSGGMSPKQYKAKALYELGVKFYKEKEYSNTYDYLTQARELDPTQKFEPLMSCALAMQSANPKEEVARLFTIFPPQEMLDMCQISSAQENIKEEIVLPIIEEFLPWFYKGSSTDEFFHFNLKDTVLQGRVPLNDDDIASNFFQVGRDWGERVRGGAMEFSMAMDGTLSPGSEIGWQIRGSNNKLLLFVLVVENDNRSRPNVKYIDSTSACTLVPPKFYNLTDETQHLQPHILSFTWDVSSKTLMLMVDGEVVCKPAVEWNSSPKVSLYLSRVDTSGFAHIGVSDLRIYLSQ